VPGDYLLRLDVFDGEDTAFDQVVVTVQPPPQAPPPPPPPPPARREIQGELTADRPTIVLTHGLEADVASLWTGFSATPGAQGAGHILNHLLGQQVNIVQYLWEEGLQGFSPSAYSAAFPYTTDAGAVLARLLTERLGPGYQHPIHFIGHSLGAVVNAYAARQFLTATPMRGITAPCISMMSLWQSPSGQVRGASCKEARHGTPGLPRALSPCCHPRAPRLGVTFKAQGLFCCTPRQGARA